MIGIDNQPVRCCNVAMDQFDELDSLIKEARNQEAECRTRLRLLWWMCLLALLVTVAGFLAPVFLLIRAM